jgi:hypothetical protein
MSDPKLQTTSDALAEWRQAEQTAAVARRGRVAAEIAATAAEEAEEAARATADSARVALKAAGHAEESAAKTAKAAMLIVQMTRTGLADSVSEVALADVSEAVAQEHYRAAVERAADRQTDKV